LLKHVLFFYIIIISIIYFGGLKWLVIILSTALVHIYHAHVMANAVNVLHIIARKAKHLDASFRNPVKRLTTGLLTIFIRIL